MAQLPPNELSLVDTTATVSGSVLQQGFDGERVLLDLDTGHYFGLDHIGAAIWLLLQQHAGSCAHVIESMLDQFDVEHDRLVEDLGWFVNRLQAAKLVKLASAVVRTV